MPAHLARIQSILPHANPRFVLAWMRSNTGGTIDRLTDDDFASHARFAAECAATAPMISARLAEIMGI